MASTESESARTERLLIDSAKSSTTDLYALLSLPSPFIPSTGTTYATSDPLPASTLKSAWRKAALKWHPDKNPGRETEAADKLDEIRKAYDILSHPAARAAYDEKLRARAEKQAREAAFQGKRRRMKEELEAREKGSRPGTPAGGANGSGGGASATGSPQAGQKRKFGNGTAFGVGSGGVHAASNGEDDPELRRLAAEGARRRQEREEKMRREREEARRRADADEQDGELDNADQAQSNATNGLSTPVKKFSFATPSSSAQKTGVGTGIGTPSSASTKSLFQSTMQRLREAEQRRKSGLQELIAQ